MIPASGSAVMQFDNFAIVIEQEPEEYSPSLPDCCSNGRTIEESKRNTRAAIQQLLASLLTYGDDRSTGPAAAAGASRTN